MATGVANAGARPNMDRLSDFRCVCLGESGLKSLESRLQTTGNDGDSMFYPQVHY